MKQPSNEACRWNYLHIWITIEWPTKWVLQVELFTHLYKYQKNHQTKPAGENIYLLYEYWMNHQTKPAGGNIYPLYEYWSVRILKEPPNEASMWKCLPSQLVEIFTFCINIEWTIKWNQQVEITLCTNIERTTKQSQQVENLPFVLLKEPPNNASKWKYLPFA